MWGELFQERVPINPSYIYPGFAGLVQAVLLPYSPTHSSATWFAGSSPAHRWTKTPVRCAGLFSTIDGGNSSPVRNTENIEYEVHEIKRFHLSDLTPGSQFLAFFVLLFQVEVVTIHLMTSPLPSRSSPPVNRHVFYLKIYSSVQTEG